MDQSQYIKQLEERLEELQEKYTMTSHALNALVERETKNCLFIYEISVRKKQGEWICWAYGFHRSSCFSHLKAFKESLKEYDQISMTSKRISKSKYSESWIYDEAWRIRLDKNKKNKFVISNFETYLLGYCDKMVGKSLEGNIKRWMKE